jgi:hypothetical protein
MITQTQLKQCNIIKVWMIEFPLVFFYPNAFILFLRVIFSSDAIIYHQNVLMQFVSTCEERVPSRVSATRYLVSTHLLQNVSRSVFHYIIELAKSTEKIVTLDGMYVPRPI